MRHLLQAALLLASCAYSQTVTIVWEGDSITSPNGNPNSYANVVNTALSPTLDSHNQDNPPNVYSGSIIVDNPSFNSMDRRSPGVDSIFAASVLSHKVESILIGHNDLVYVSTPAQYVSDLKAYCLARKAATPGLKIMLLPLLPSNQSTSPGPNSAITFNAARNSVNALVAADPSFYDLIVPGILTDTNIGVDGAETNLTYFFDGVHPTTLGQSIIAGYVEAALPSLYSGSGTVSDVRVTGVTPTQAVITYTVSGGGGTCTLEVSQSPTYSPVVNDVNATMFTNANVDAGGADGVRTWVVGKRRTDTSVADSKNYSRALETDRAYYYRFSGCGTASGFFTTRNLPTGFTRGEYPQIDTAGAWKIPYWDHTTRGYEVIEQHAGVKYKSITVDSDGTLGGSLGLSFGGAGGLTHPCDSTVYHAPDGTSGFICTGWDNNAGGAAFYFKPATGDTVPLGHVSGAINPIIEPGGVYYVYQSGGSPPGWYVYKYTGDFTAQSFFVNDGGTLYNQYDIGVFLHNFDSTFDNTSGYFSCSQPTGAGLVHYKSGIWCQRVNGNLGNQNIYGWLAVADSGDGRPWDTACTGSSNCPQIVAAWNTFTTPGPLRWGGNHNWALIPNTGLIEFNAHSLNDFGNVVGIARWEATMPNGMTANQNPITISGQLHSVATAPGPDNYTQNLQVGDSLGIGYGSYSPDEQVTITSITAGSGSELILGVIHQNTSLTEPVGAVVWALPNLGGAAMLFWDYVADPHGTSVPQDCCWDFGGHDTFSPLRGMVEEGWQGRVGYPMNTITNTPLNMFVDNSPLFAGVIGRGYQLAQHPSFETDFTIAPPNANWFTDNTPWTDEFNPLNPNSALVSTKSQTYIYTPNFPINRKQLDTFAKSGTPTGSHGLVDVSGPGSSLCDTGTCNFQYCVALVAGECVSGSSSGNIYFNLTTLDYPTCIARDGPYPFQADICIGDGPKYGQGIDQLYFGVGGFSTSTPRSRTLGQGMAGLEMTCSCAPTARAFPDASWVNFPVGMQISSNLVNQWAGKAPTVPPLDTIDRTNFEQIPLKLTNPGGISATNAVIDFGYLESGPFATISNFYCTSRQEKCVAGTTVSPYAFPVEGSGGVDSGLTGTSCASTCTVSIPAIPGRVVYYQVRWRDSSNTTVQTDAHPPIAVP